MKIYERALELKQETITHRRWFHRTAEVGLEMPQAQTYVLETLQNYGLEPKPCGHGVVAELGSGGKCLLLRADMDALPMAEESGLEFASATGRAHACGHDCHAAILLTAAKLLKERETELQGRVRLMFQPAEETLEGCLHMIAHGVLDPKPDAALALHVAAGKAEPGTWLYQEGKKAMLLSVENFEIRITGTGAHGAYPNLAVDPIAIGVQIHMALQTLIAREADPRSTCILAVGQFQAGETGNVIPQEAVLRGALRTDDPAVGMQLHRRVEAVCSAVAGSMNGHAAVCWKQRIPPLTCDPSLTMDLVKTLQELPISGLQVLPGAAGNASEDFACIAAQIPSCYFFLTAGFSDERGETLAHNPKVQFNEEALPVGAAGLAYCALRWLQG